VLNLTNNKGDKMAKQKQQAIMQVEKQEKTEMQTQTETTKLKFKKNESLGGLTFVSAGDLNPGDVAAQGQFDAIVANPKTKKNDYRILQMDDEGNLTGTTLIVNGAGNLAFRMKDIQLGEIIQIEYVGKSAMKSGPFKGTLAHNFEVHKAY
jgi:hypothetical protein